MGNFERRNEGEASAERDLWVCEDGCGGEMVYPVQWEAAGPRHWKLVLRCPECEHPKEGVFTNEQVDSLDEEIDRGIAAILGDLQSLTHANMSEEVEFFVKVLDADIVTADDF